MHRIAPLIVMLKCYCSLFTRCLHEHMVKPKIFFSLLFPSSFPMLIFELIHSINSYLIATLHVEFKQK